jgi:uncharacterized protein YggE
MRIVGIVLAAFMVTLPFHAAAEASKDIRTITVSGKAEKTLEAHRATIRLSIKHMKPEMNQSHVALMETLSRLTRELKAVGLENKEITKSLVLQGAEYSWEKNSHVLKGYYSECYMDVTVNDIKKMPDVYRVLADHKTVTIQNTDFERNDEFEVRKAEFEKALLAAKKKAEFMAQTLGAKIGKVHSIQEVGADNWFEAKPYEANVMEKREFNADQTGYGTIKITARVMVEFELE